MDSKENSNSKSPNTIRQSLTERSAALAVGGQAQSVLRELTVSPEKRELGFQLQGAQ